MIDYIVNNWPVIIAALAILVVAIINVINFFKKPTEEQISALKSWLLYAVVLAEKSLGSGTGKIKLRYVYDMFLEKFPSLVKFISFDQFSEYVDSALEEMRKLLETNNKISAYINSEN